MAWYNKKATEAAAAEKVRADKLQAQLQKLLDKEQAREDRELEERLVIEQEEAEANRTAMLAAEEKERKEAEKTLATEAGEPWINIVSMEMEPENGANIGAIEMDWNEQFIKVLQQNGYIGVSDEDAVDQWFRDVCKHVILETYEDEESAGERVVRNELDDGRAEYS